ncbi:17361_t:CDS:2 [Funneliformis caledonium]|uniref:17361_t:CDS:1 n=1 Tax=Funneliformis caledonium TaxID=1117310 RepID=A0A9N8W6H7_9GLOM|nr:17361_t:CDS:2 [Funneliformis caledonium]
MRASSKLLFSVLGYLISTRIIISAPIEEFSISEITLQRSSNIISNSYIIEFDNSNDQEKDQDFVASFARTIQGEGINHKIRETFNPKVFNGASIKLDDEKDLNKLKKLKGVKRVWPVTKIQRSEFKVVENKSNSSILHSSIGVVEAREQFGIDGSGIKVGIIDTGIDYKHPALGGCFKKDGCKVQFGYDFVGDDFNGTNVPKPDDDPLDECVGHGTHAAGIIAGEDSANNVTGIAPKVTLGAYRIFGCNGETTSELVIKAMEKAFEDGMDIINLSLVSGDNAWFGGPESLVAEKLTENGLFVVAAAGSSGDKGIFKSSSPSTSPGVISVASIDSEQIDSFFIQPGSNSTRKIQYLTQDGNAIELEDSFSIIPTSNTTNSKDDACEPINEDLTGKVALIRKGGCEETKKINVAQAAGATAIVLYNNVDGITTPEFDQNGIIIPVAMISCKDGVLLIDEIKKDDNFTVKFPRESTLFDNLDTLKISAFSSYGPTNELDIKPDIAAPGSNVFSTFPVSLGSFQTLSGTSISTPFVTGILALVMQNKGKSNSTLARDILQNNAKPLFIKNSETEVEGNKTSIIATTILQQGAGLINLVDALTSTVIISPAKLALNDSAHFNGKKRSLTLTNVGQETTKFTFDHLPAQSITGFDGVNLVPIDTPFATNSFAKVKFSKSSIRLRPGESQSINLSFTPPKDLSDLDHSLYSGYIVVKDTFTKKEFYVSYMGMKGCLDTLPIVDNQSGAPFLQSGINDQKFFLPEDVLTVTMKGDDIALFGVRFAQGTKILTVDVIPAESDDDVKEPAEPTKAPTETQPTKQPTKTQTTEKPTGTQTTEKPTGTQTTEKPTGTQTTEKPTGTQTTEKPTGTQTTEKPTETQTTEKPTGTQTTEKPTETQPTEQPTDAQPTEKPTETQPTEQPTTTPDEDDGGIVTITTTVTTTPIDVPTETPLAKRSIKAYKLRNNELKSRAFDEDTTKLLVPNSLGTITNNGIIQFQQRNDNSDSNNILTLQFDGTIDKSNGEKGVELPDGRYRLFLAALRPFGNPTKKDHWETFTSSIIEIKRE